MLNPSYPVSLRDEVGRREVGMLNPSYPISLRDKGEGGGGGGMLNPSYPVSLRDKGEGGGRDAKSVIPGLPSGRRWTEEEAGC